MFKMIKSVKLNFLFLLLSISALAQAQNVPYSILYDDTLVNTILITMDPDSLDELYDELENEHEYAVLFVYQNGVNSDTLENVGLRLRGNTSLESAKKSFKISFNTYVTGRRFEGAKKLNLIGNHNDPTMSREKIYFDIYNDFGLPTRRVSFAKFYINDTYYGLYSLTEEYDDIFLQDRFGESSGNLYKCLYGSTLEYNGPSQSEYNTYELITNEQQNDKSDLVNLADVLNNTPIADLSCELEKIFDVAGFLKIYALDVSTGHWDNYGANQNNYYLYHNQSTGKFQFLSYDCDNVLGVDWFGIDWAERDIYNWNFDDRPLVERLFQIPEYVDLFSYYLNQLSTTIMVPATIFPHIDSIRDLIAPAALEDVFRTYDYGFTYDDFYDGFNTNNIIGHTPYGIENFISARVDNSLSQVELNDIAPILENETHIKTLPQPGEEIIIRLFALDDNSINNCSVFYSEDNIAFTQLNLFDDGVHNDSLPADDIFGATISSGSDDTELFYYFEATDNIGNIKRYPVCETINIHIGSPSQNLVINEFMAKNETTITDDFGGYADYIELFNPGPENIFLTGKYLSDDFDQPAKWPLPDRLMLPNTYIIIWADDDTEEGNVHTNFNLDASGDEIGIFSGPEYYYSVIDTISFRDQVADISTGRLPNGSGNFVTLPQPSPGANNEATIPVDSTLQFQFIILGNPSFGNGEISLDLFEPSDIVIDLLSINGQIIERVENAYLQEGRHNYTLQSAFLSSGMYFIRLEKNGESSFYKFIEL
ncbi:MAG: CotH kinase family protein [Bacteroidetes bacterium]|jgi:spore coat protein H|nr:CotH kinase family protein [Bacteroidota bacterium]